MLALPRDPHPLGNHGGITVCSLFRVLQQTVQKKPVSTREDRPLVNLSTFSVLIIYQGLAATHLSFLLPTTIALDCTHKNVEVWLTSVSFIAMTAHRKTKWWMVFGCEKCFLVHTPLSFICVSRGDMCVTRVKAFRRAQEKNAWRNWESQWKKGKSFFSGRNFFFWQKMNYI